MLYSEIVEADCRIIPELPGKCKLDRYETECKLIEGDTGERFFITKQLNRDAVYNDLKRIKDAGFNSIAVVLAHSYAYKEHELEIGEIAKEIGE